MKNKTQKTSGKNDSDSEKRTDPDGKSSPKRRHLTKKVYEKELFKLQLELVKLQAWIKHKGLKVVIIFEGRDAAGKGGVIKRIDQIGRAHV